MECPKRCHSDQPRPGIKLPGVAQAAIGRDGEHLEAARRGLEPRRGTPDGLVELVPVGPAGGGVGLLLPDVAEPAVHRHGEHLEAAIGVREEHRGCPHRKPKVVPARPPRAALSLVEVSQTALGPDAEHLEAAIGVLSHRWSATNMHTEVVPLRPATVRRQPDVPELPARAHGEDGHALTGDQLFQRQSNSVVTVQLDRAHEPVRGRKLLSRAPVARIAVVNVPFCIHTAAPT